MRALLAGVYYFAIVFALGFALGTIRVLFIVPLLGELGAVFLELPIMLVASWFVCSWLVRRFQVPPAVEARLIMGGIAFVLLMLAELAVSVFAFGRSPAEHWGTYSSASALWGLAAQVAFAAMPLVRRPAGSFRSAKSAEASSLRNQP